MNKDILNKLNSVLEEIKQLPENERIETLNEIKSLISEASPFEEQPVECVKWIPSDKIHANDYNPNAVAPPEMKLLETSIIEDGYTQPIVAYYDKAEDKYIIVDGFHRNRVGKESKIVSERVKGYLPIVVIEKTLNDRVASTIRHNRARGTHQIESMSTIVAELYFTGWTNKMIGEKLGMGKDEVTRLKQFTGLGALFKDRDFSKAWEA